MASRADYNLPYFARLKYWLGFAYLTKYGKLLSEKAEEHRFKASIGTALYNSGEKSLLKFAEKRLPKKSEDIPIEEIQSGEVTDERMAAIRKDIHPVLIKGGAKVVLGPQDHFQKLFVLSEFLNKQPIIDKLPKIKQIDLTFEDRIIVQNKT